MIVNKYAKKCQCCGTLVKVGQGFAYNNGSGWFTACASSACHRHLGLTVTVNITANANVRKLTEDGKVYMAYDREAVPLLRAMPGARFNPEGLPKDKVYWQVSTKPADLPRVLEIADQLKLEVPESLREAVNAGTAESREAVTRAKAVSVNGKKLFEFQIKGVEFLALHNRGFLADDMGLGKTLESIVALPEGVGALVVCPASLKYNWRDEIQMWRPELKVTICKGNNNLKFPDNQDDLRQWTIAEFGDCCECGLSLDNEMGLDHFQQSQDLSLGIEVPSILNLGLSNGLVGLDVSNVLQTPKTTEPIDEIKISIPDLNSPRHTDTTALGRNSGDRSLAINNSSNVSNGNLLGGQNECISLPDSLGNDKPSTSHHRSKGISTSSKTRSNTRKRSSGSECFESRFELGSSNICPRCSRHISPKSEIVIITYNTLPSYLSPSKSTGEKTRSGKEIKVADLTKEQTDQLSEIVLICDEAHLCKNYKAIRSQRVSQLSRLCKRVWFLSGTPLMNNPPDLFGVLSAGNMNVFGGWDNFLRLFNGYKNQWGGYEFGMPLPEVPERMQRVMLRRLKTEVLKDLPPKVYQDIEVDCDGTLTKKLNTFLGKATGKKIDYDNLDFEDEIDVEELPAFSEFSEIRALLAEARIPAMLEIVESYEDSGTPLAVFSAHKKPIEALADRVGWRIITGDTDPEDRRNFVREFQEGKLKGIALTIKTGGVGVTLTRATNALFVDLDWTPSWNIQAEDRLVRIGATGSHVLIMRMRSNHPLDRHIQKLLAHKIALAYKALEASIKFKPPPPRMPGVAVIEETDAEMMTRINAAGDEVEREIALGKLHGVLARESAKVNDVPEPELTPGRKEMLRGALEYMISVCDGAETRDQMGFNKPDAFMSRWIGMCLRDEDDVSYRVLERILVRYRRQLKGRFEEIWKPALEAK